MAARPLGDRGMSASDFKENMYQQLKGSGIINATKVRSRAS